MGSNSNTPAAERKNRFDGIFGKVTFKAASTNAKVYDNDGTQSKKLATVLVELGTTGAFLEGKISAEQPKGAKAPHAVFLWFAAQNRGQAIKVDGDPGAMADMDEYRRNVVRQYMAWRKANTSAPTTTTTEDKDAILEGITLG